MGKHRIVCGTGRELSPGTVVGRMPQIYGANFGSNPDGNLHLDLQGHERLNVRLLFGFGF